MNSAPEVDQAQAFRRGQMRSAIRAFQRGRPGTREGRRYRRERGRPLEVVDGSPGSGCGPRCRWCGRCVEGP